MVAGEHISPTESRSHEDLPIGAAVTASGRVSAAHDAGADPPPEGPFTPVQLARIDEVLTRVSRHTGLQFSIYLGVLGGPARPAAERLYQQLGAAAVLIAVDPGRRETAIVTGPAARVRLADRSCHLAVMSMTASFSEGDLVGGLLSGLRMLADQVGPSH